MQQNQLYVDLGMSESQYSQEVIEGQQVYTPSFLRFYDLFVLHIISRWFWRCVPQNMIDLYSRNLSGNHLYRGGNGLSSAKGEISDRKTHHFGNGFKSKYSDRI